MKKMARFGRISVLCVVISMVFSMLPAALGGTVSIATMKTGIGKALETTQQELVITLESKVTDEQIYNAINEAFEQYYQGAYMLQSYNLSMVRDGTKTTLKFRLTYDFTKAGKEVWQASSYQGITNAAYMLIDGRMPEKTIFISGKSLTSDENADFVNLIDRMGDTFIYGKVDAANGLDILETSYSVMRAPGVNNDERGWYVTLWYKYNESARQRAASERLLRKQATSILKTAHTQREIIDAINAFVVTEGQYEDSGSPLDHSPYGLLFTGKGVCQAYASVTQILLEYTGIQSRSIFGETTQGAHVWNLVKSDDKWMHLDVTFNDPLPDVPERVMTKYTMLTNEQIYGEHVWEIGNYTNTENQAYLTKTALYNSREVLLSIGSPFMYVDGVRMQVDFGRGTTPQALDNRVLVPVRSIAEALGGYVEWDQELKKITITINGNLMIMTLDSPRGSYNGEIIEFDVRPTAVDQRIMMPARAVFETFGYKVDWNAAIKQISVTK